MKGTLLFLLILCNISSFSQSNTDCETIKLKSEEDYRIAETCIIDLSNLVLDQPMYGITKKAQFARKVVYAWVEGTPDYTFNLNKKIMNVFKKDNVILFYVYVCCLANAALSENSEFHKYALELLVNYIRDPKNKVTQSSAVKNLIKNWDKGLIEKYLKNN